MNIFGLKDIKGIIFRWWKKIFFAISDQGVILVSNFILHFLLARWMSPSEYGQFAMLHSMSFIGIKVQNSLVSEPMVVYGVSKYKKSFNTYVNLNILGSVFISILMLVLIIPFYRSLLCVAVIAYILTFSLLELMRKTQYILQAPQKSLAVNFVYTFTLFFLLIYAKQNILINVSIVFIVISIASLLCALLIKILMLQLQLNSTNDTQLSIKVLCQDHWSFGKWHLGANLTNWVNNMVFVPFVYFCFGSTEAGGYKAMQNLIMPGRRSFFALRSLLLPWLSDNYSRCGGEYIKRTRFKLTVLYVFFAIFMSGIILILRDKLVILVYDNDFYLKYAWLLPYMCFSFIITMMSQSQVLLLHAQKITKPIFLYNFVGSVLTLLLGFIFVMKVGLLGVIITPIITSMINYIGFHFELNKLDDNNVS